MNQNTPSYQFLRTLYRMPPNAVAVISGNQENPQLRGIVRFYQTAYQGILIEAEISGLPYETDRTSSSTVSASQNSSASPTSSASPDLPASMASPFSFYAMHIHQFGNCTLPFDKTGEHYNPDQLPIRNTQAIYSPFSATTDTHGAPFMMDVSPSMKSSENP